MRALTRSSLRISAVSRWTKTVIGTPQARWRETTQSGRLPTMPVIRFLPCSGTHWVSSMPWRATARSVRSPSESTFRSIAMNHCGVLRKITGFLERQECGYW
jgi:hypothetical protein